MFGTLKTLITGASARAEDQVRDRYAIELIDQKIREAEATLVAAKTTLASLIQRQRNETRLIEALDTRLADLTSRATDALKAGREDLARQAAEAIAGMENERAVRRQTLDRLETRVCQLRASIDTAHRRIIDLKQGAITARAIRREQDMQDRLNRTLAGPSPADEAQALIDRVTQDDDPFEQSEILREIDGGLTHGDIAETLAEAGFGANTKSTGPSVLNRLRDQI